MTTERDETRRINCAALRTLHALEHTLEWHLTKLMEIDCEDAEAAETIVFALEAAERTLEQTRAAKRRLFAR